jgi:hypothetical protein
MHLSTTIPRLESRISRPEESVHASKRIDDDFVSDAFDRFGQGAGEDSYSGVRPLRNRIIKKRNFLFVCFKGEIPV